jgi:hypothetical protein
MHRANHHHPSNPSWVNERFGKMQRRKTVRVVFEFTRIVSH